MKFLLDLFDKNRIPQFAIRREQRKNGKERLTPMVKLRISNLIGDWTPIVKAEDKYHALHIERDYCFTEDECRIYIAGYKKQIEDEQGQGIRKVIFEEIS